MAQAPAGIIAEPDAPDRPRTPAATAPVGRPEPLARALASALLLAFPAALLLVMGFHRRWTSDDSFIDFRVVQQLLAGHGPVYNVGERVEAFTSPLWLLLLTAWTRLLGHVEVGAVAMGLLFTIVGVAAAQAGAARLAADRRGLPLPLGMAIYAVVPGAWDFATSGLESGLVIAWLGAAYWLVAGRARAADDGRRGRVAARSARGRALAGVFLGLGPLVRPDMAGFSAGFLVAYLSPALLAPCPARRLRAAPAVLVPAAALPVAYELFRMGYYAALVPNTALAKEAGLPYWAAGGAYFGDFFETYTLWVPLAVALTWWAALFLAAWDRRRTARMAALLAPVLLAGVHIVYTMRVGGDFMHARFLLPGLFCLLLPVAVVRLPRSAPPAALAGLAVVVGWCLVCGLWLHLPYPNAIGPYGIADERGFYVTAARMPNPITIGDHQADAKVQDALRLRQLVRERAPARFIFQEDPNQPAVPLAPSVPPSVRAVWVAEAIGQRGYLAGPEIRIVDRHGLTDPLAGRLLESPRGGRIGHEKDLPPEWVFARLAAPQAALPDPAGVAAARQALRCGDLPVLLAAVTEPLTWQRFSANLALAPRLTRLRIPGDPLQARQQFCGGR